ncbi:MAG: sporulation protein YqfD [Clostridia bacterium]|nr:sporulation protein YqfD [Clostridia bacterium]
MNFMAGQRLAFWDVHTISGIELECTVFSSAKKKVLRASSSRGFDVLAGEAQGLPGLLRLVRQRPVFAAGFVLCAFLLAYLPRYVWTVQIEGNELVHTQTIRRVMDDYGVHFGADGRNINSQMLEARIKNDIPELKWCAVNQKGGCVTISVSEREAVPDSEVDHTITNVIAACDGVITKTEIYGGFRRCKVGDAVQKGELLISGIESFEKSTQLTHAFGEIYAMTQHAITAKTPQTYMQKQYTGRRETHYSLILGRKRINLFGNSGIPQGSCDKIIKRSQLTLPGDYPFPVWLETETLIYYEPVCASLDQQSAYRRLCDYTQASAQEQMIAGKILASKNQIKRYNDCWVLSATLSCEEMIARLVPVQIEESETEDGGTDH